MSLQRWRPPSFLGSLSKLEGDKATLQEFGRALDFALKQAFEAIYSLENQSVQGVLGLTQSTPTEKTPGTPWQIMVDDSFIYVYTSSGWKKAALANL